MANLSMHDILTFLGESNKFGGHKDRLSRIVDQTLSMAEEMSDAGLAGVMAARKSDDSNAKDLFEDEEQE